MILVHLIGFETISHFETYFISRNRIRKASKMHLDSDSLKRKPNPMGSCLDVRRIDEAFEKSIGETCPSRFSGSKSNQHMLRTSKSMRWSDLFLAVSFEPPVTLVPRPRYVR